MSDWYRDFANSGVGATVTKQLGLPRPAVLRRYTPGQPLLPGPAARGVGGPARLRQRLEQLLEANGLAIAPAQGADTEGPEQTSAKRAPERLAAVVLDATGLRGPSDLVAAQA
ncbi:MAG: hypothetical protein ACTHNT_08395, partial [Actinomycetales bacterium]